MSQSHGVTKSPNENPQPHGEIADVERLTSFCSECDWAVTHAGGRCDGRQEGRESGYYHLHRNLNDPFLHDYSLFTVHYSLTLVIGKAVATVAAVRA